MLPKDPLSRPSDEKDKMQVHPYCETEIGIRQFNRGIVRKVKGWEI
jgi:hypothetical protein